MPTLPQLLPLKTAINKAKASGKPILVVGIGAELRGDDIVGVLVAREIEALLRPDIKGIAACAAPENFTGEIISCNPSLVIFVDAANLGLEPGKMRLIQADEIQGISFSTHTLPLSVILDYLAKSLASCSFAVVGVQPKSTEVLGVPSQEIQDAAKKLVEFLI